MGFGSLSNRDGTVVRVYHHYQLINHARKGDFQKSDPESDKNDEQRIAMLHGTRQDSGQIRKAVTNLADCAVWAIALLISPRSDTTPFACAG
jgi:hypothetical protein